MIRNAANALRILFDNQKRDLNLEQLEWFSGLNEYAQLQASNVATTLTVMATSISTGGSGAPGDEEIVEILFGLASQAETVSALAHIGSEADFLASELKGKSDGQ